MIINDPGLREDAEIDRLGLQGATHVVHRWRHLVLVNPVMEAYVLFSGVVLGGV